MPLSSLFYGKTNRFVLNFSGGRDSTAILLHLIDAGMIPFRVVYFDYGDDFPEVVAVVNRFRRELSDIFVTIKSPRPLKSMIKHVCPTDTDFISYHHRQNKTRTCRRYKQGLISDVYKSFVNPRYELFSMLGHRQDEQQRINAVLRTNSHVLFPLVSWGFGDKEINNIIHAHNVDYGDLYLKFKSTQCQSCPLLRYADGRFAVKSWRSNGQCSFYKE